MSSATIHHTLFLAKERPLVTRTSAGDFALQMLCMDALDNGGREPWRITWVGPEAATWWSLHGDSLKPGQPLDVRADRIRAHITVRAPEIHARVLSLQLSAWRHQPRPDTASGTHQPHHAHA